MELTITTSRRSFGRSASAVVRGVLCWPARVIAARSAMLQLGQMTARELKDIGLVPQDLADVTALSLAADPTAVLARRARERRRPDRAR